MIKFKASGIQTDRQLEYVSRYRIDGVGFNISKNLPYFISLEKLVDFYDQLDNEAQKILHLADNDDNDLNEILTLMDFDYIELSGREDKRRIADIFDHTGIPIIKNIVIDDLEDLWQAQQWVTAVDYLQFEMDNISVIQRCESFDFSGFEKPWILKANIAPSEIFYALCAIRSDFIDISHLLQTDRVSENNIATFIAEAERAMFDA